jgi:hypothetical protein
MCSGAVDAGGGCANAGVAPACQSGTATARTSSAGVGPHPFPACPPWPPPRPPLQVWWGVIEDGQPPKQIIEGGEYFVLKRIPGGDSHHH